MKKAWWVAIVTLVAALVVPLSAEPAMAAYPTSTYDTGAGGSFIYGDLIWYNRSVRVGGTVGDDDGVAPCAAVVYTGYDGSGRAIARAARPGDDKYTCGSLGHGFTLDASSVSGGIRWVEIDLWLSNGILAASIECWRVDAPSCNYYS